MRIQKSMFCVPWVSLLRVAVCCGVLCCKASCCVILRCNALCCIVLCCVVFCCASWLYVLWVMRRPQKERPVNQYYFICWSAGKIIWLTKLLFWKSGFLIGQWARRCQRKAKRVAWRWRQAALKKWLPNCKKALRKWLPEWESLLRGFAVLLTVWDAMWTHAFRWNPSGGKT